MWECFSDLISRSRRCNFGCMFVEFTSRSAQHNVFDPLCISLFSTSKVHSGVGNPWKPKGPIGVSSYSHLFSWFLYVEVQIYGPDYSSALHGCGCRVAKMLVRMLVNLIPGTSSRSQST